MASVTLSDPIIDHPRIILAGARAIYIGPGFALSPHRNAVATLAVALALPFEIAWPLFPDRPAKTRTIALIPPDTLHHLITAGPMMFVYLDALADDQRTIDLLINAQPDAQPPLVALCAAIAVTTDATHLVSALLAALGLNENPAQKASPGIAATIRAIDDRPDDFASAKVAADFARMSQSSFHRAIRHATGVPFRRYRLWRRLAIAAKALRGGADLTDAAMEGGFASSAHFSATFRRMFGIKPSMLINANAQFDIVDAACGPTTLA